MSRALLVAAVLLVSGAVAERCAAQPTLVAEQTQPLRYQGAFSFALPGRRYAHFGSLNPYNAATQTYSLTLAVTKQNGDTVRLAKYINRLAGTGPLGFFSVTPEPDHSFMVYGWYYPSPRTAMDQDSLVLLRVDTLGVIRWRRGYHQSYAYGYRQGLRTGDGYLVCSNRDAFPGVSGPLSLTPNVTKFDFQGRLVWERPMAGRAYAGVGAVNDLVACPDGSYLAIGNTDNGTPYTPGASVRGRFDYYAVRFNTYGDTLRTYRFGVAGVDEAGTQLRPTPDGGWALIGYRLRPVPPGNSPPQDGQLFKLDSLLRPQWSQTLAWTGVNQSVRTNRYTLFQPLTTGDILAGGTAILSLSATTSATGEAGQLRCHSSTGGLSWDFQRRYQNLPHTAFTTMVNHTDGSALLTGVVSNAGPFVQNNPTAAYSAYLTNVGIPYVADLCARPPVAGFAPALAAGRDSLLCLDTSRAGPRYAALVAWRWEWGDGSTSEGPQPPWHRYATVPASGTAVRLSVTNNLGCTSTTAEYPWGGRPTATAAPAALGAGATLYPNPASGPLTLTVPQWPGAGPVAVQVLDGLGRVVQTGAARVAGGTLTAGLDVRGLPAGIYAVRVLAPAGSLTKRLVRE